MKSLKVIASVIITIFFIVLIFAAATAFMFGAGYGTCYLFPNLITETYYWPIYGLVGGIVILSFILVVLIIMGIIYASISIYEWLFVKDE